MRIHVVCGAGASSTFVAQRLQQAARERGLPYTASAGSERLLPLALESADVLLVGPHLASDIEQIAGDAAGRGVTAVLLPEDVFTDRSGQRTLALVEAALPRRPAAATSPRPATEKGNRG